MGTLLVARQTRSDASGRPPVDSVPLLLKAWNRTGKCPASGWCRKGPDEIPLRAQIVRKPFSSCAAVTRNQVTNNVRSRSIAPLPARSTDSDGTLLSPNPARHYERFLLKTFQFRPSNLKFFHSIQACVTASPSKFSFSLDTGNTARATIREWRRLPSTDFIGCPYGLSR